jgi:[ribosomal protein S5]-alanine N-acetyltransferase
MDQDLVIQTKRFLLFTVLPSEYEVLAKDQADPKLWLDRGFSDPDKHFLTNQNPIKYRLPEVRQNPEYAKYLLRVAVIKDNPIIIGSAGFHNAPDSDGMIEIGFGVDKKYQGNGYGQEILHGMWSWVVNDPLVKTLRYTVSPDNLISHHIIKKLSFEYKGQQIDEKDGPEDIYALSSNDYKLRI